MGLPEKLKTGYIFGVKDPDTGLYIYVGLSKRPAEYIYRMMTTRSICPPFFDWTQALARKHPLGIEILSDIVVDRFHAKLRGEPIPELPPRHPYKILVEWDILSMQDEESHGATISVSSPSRRNQIVRDLQEQGHPIMVKIAGRKPKGYWNRPENQDEKRERDEKLRRKGNA